MAASSPALAQCYTTSAMDQGASREKLKALKRGLIALLFTLLSRGLGQIYNGQILKGAALYASGWVLLAISVGLGLFQSFQGLLVVLATGLAWFLFVLIDAVWIAARQATKPRPRRGWPAYAVGGAVLMLSMATGLPGRHSAVILSSLAGVRAYRIRAASMAPTLIIGDRIVVAPQYYKDHSPKRGNVVVIVMPPQGVLLAKRVIGLPGDRIKIVHSIVYVDGKALTEPYAVHDSSTYDPFAENFPPTNSNYLDPMVLPQWRAEMPRYVNKSGELVVPPGKYFVLGDNRDDSEDSRYFGLVGIRRIRGKVLYIYWSPERKRIGRAIH